MLALYGSYSCLLSFLSLSVPPHCPHSASLSLLDLSVLSAVTSAARLVIFFLLICISFPCLLKVTLLRRLLRQILGGGADVAHTETCASTQAWIQPLGWSLQRGCNEKERHRCLHLIHMMKLRIRYEGEGDLTFTINLLSFSCMLITFGLQFTVNVWEKHLEQLVGRQLGLQRHHWYLGEQCLPGVTDWYQLISKEFLQHTLVPCGNCNF